MNILLIQKRYYPDPGIPISGHQTQFGDSDSGASNDHATTGRLKEDMPAADLPTPQSEVARGDK
jgi:hypothetical protein